MRRFDTAHRARDTDPCFSETHHTTKDGHDNIFVTEFPINLSLSKIPVCVYISQYECSSCIDRRVRGSLCVCVVLTICVENYLWIPRGFVCVWAVRISGEVGVRVYARVLCVCGCACLCVCGCACLCVSYACVSMRVWVCVRCESQEKLACVSMPVSYVCAGGANLRRTCRACLCPCCMCVRAARISGELVVRVYARVLCVCGRCESLDKLACVSMPVLYVCAGSSTSTTD